MLVKILLDQSLILNLELNMDVKSMELNLKKKFVQLCVLGLQMIFLRPLKNWI